MNNDLISREALKEQINATDFDFGDYYDNTKEIRKRICEVIDNAQTVESSQGEWADNDPPEKSEQAKGEPFTAVCDHNDGIFDPTYINDEVDCTDLGIYPWGNS